MYEKQGKQPALILGFFALVIVTGRLAGAESGVIEGVRIFATEYFLQFDPVNALDLVQQTPGFSPQEQNGGRGLAGVRTNILINGKRPPPKGQSIWQQLSSQPYTNVSRIELIDSSAALDIDMQGYNQVVNVILEAQDADYYELNTRYNKTGDGDIRQRNGHDTDVELTANMSWGSHDFNLVGGLHENSATAPADFVDIDPANPVQRVANLNTNGQNEKYLRLGSVFNFADASSLSVNAEVTGNEWHSEPAVVKSADVVASAISQTYENDRDYREVSAEYLRNLGERNSMMLAVVDSRNIESNSSTFAADADLLSSLRNRESGETAGRLSLTRNVSDDVTLRGIASSAYNYFEGNLDLFINGQPQSLTGSDSLVEEYRHSLALETDWTITEDWIFRGSLSGGRYSIEANSVSGNDQSEVKGNASLAWQLMDRTTLTLQSNYNIGQLGLDQFLASSNLSSEILQAGAVSLNSERSWEHTLRYDQRFGDRGVLKATLGHYISKNPIRTVALSDELTVSQNTSAEKVTWFNFNIEYPFERLGMKDLVMQANVSVRDSNTIDPVTGANREVSWIEPFEYSFGLEKNPGDSKWSWGVNLWHSVYNRDYGVRQTNIWQRSHEWRAFLQYEFFQGLRLNIRQESARSERNSAEFFSAVRRTGLDPSFIAVQNDRRDSSTRISLQWRRDKYMEITATVHPRPRFRSTEYLHAYGVEEGSFLVREIAAGPRAEIRFRLYNR